MRGRAVLVAHALLAFCVAALVVDAAEDACAGLVEAECNARKESGSCVWKSSTCFTWAGGDNTDKGSDSDSGAEKGSDSDGSVKSTSGDAGGFSVATLDVSGKTRTYAVRAPAGDATSLVVVLLPGQGASGLASSCASSLTTAPGAVVACPAAELLEAGNVTNAVKGSGGGAAACWRAFANYGYCLGGAPEGSEDVDFVAALIEHLSAEHGVQTRQVVLTGYSNGASMAYRVHCERSELLGGLAIVAQSWFDSELGYYDYVNEVVPAGAVQCRPAQDVPTIAVVGQSDEYYGVQAAIPEFEAVGRWETLSASVLGCTGARTEVDPPTGVSGTCYTFESCAETNAMCSVPGMGHDISPMGALVDHMLGVDADDDTGSPGAIAPGAWLAASALMTLAIV